MKTFLECTDLAAREIGDTGFKNWLIFKLDAEQLEHLERAAVIYAEQSKSHIPVVGGPGSDVRSEGEQLGNEGSAKSVSGGLKDCKQGHAYVRCDCKGDCEF